MNSFLLVFVVLSLSAFTVSNADCSESDRRVQLWHDVICNSLVGPGTYWCNYTLHDPYVAEDWPSQAVYFFKFIDLLIDNTTCLNTTQARKAVAWMTGPLANTSIGASYMQTYLVFQVGYYNMPYKPGQRVESPWTLGEKCWAFAYNAQYWNQKKAALLARLETEQLSIPSLVNGFDQAIPTTMKLCPEVMANCFQNSTYDPSRNGTCPMDVDLFKGGFDWENFKFGNAVNYPFPNK